MSPEEGSVVEHVASRLEHIRGTVALIARYIDRDADLSEALHGIAAQLLEEALKLDTMVAPGVIKP